MHERKGVGVGRGVGRGGGNFFFLGENFQLYYDPCMMYVIYNIVDVWMYMFCVCMCMCDDL